MTSPRSQISSVPAHHRHHQTGFTMVELMLATFLGSMIAVSVYSMFIQSSTYYSQQFDQTQVQSSTRFAMEYLKSELRDLGRLSVISTSLERRDPLYCGVRSYEGLILKDNDRGDGGYEPSDALIHNEIVPDRLQILVDASDATLLKVRRQSGVVFDLIAGPDQPTLEAQRMLSVGAEARFQSLFDRDSFVRVTNIETGRYDLVPTQNAQLQNEIGRVTLVEPPCSNLNCNSGGCSINPIHWVEYSVLFDPDEPAHTYFARRRLEQDASPIPNTELILADYVVDFQIWGDYDTRGHDSQARNALVENLPPVIPQDPLMRDDRGNWNPEQTEDTLFSMWGHRLRGINLLLSTRSARVDPKFKFSLNAEGMGPQERTSFEVTTPKKKGLTHVSTLIGSVETPNLYRGD